jgi:protein TonB
MSIAREPGPLRGGDSRARVIGWTAALALVVTTVLVAVARLATGPTPPPGLPSPTAVSAVPDRRANNVTIAPAGARRGWKPDARVAEVEIAERPRPFRPARIPRLVPETEPSSAAAPPSRLPAPPLSASAKKAVPITVVPLKPAPPVPAKPEPSTAAPSGEREGERIDSPLETQERPEARYPEDAAAEGVTGKVRLKVVVDPRGEVEDALVVRSSGDDRLDRAAEEAVRRWRYRPARRGGRMVTATDYVEVEFYREQEDNSKD